MVLSMFCRKGTTSCSNVASLDPKKAMELWHKRLGHLGERRMHILPKMDLLGDHKVKT